MAYIETHQALFTHRKTLRLARLLQLDTFAVVGRLMALWCWALDNAQEGIIPKHDIDLIDTVMSAGCPPDVLCNALVASGFLDETSDAYVIHDWFDYAGKLIEKRKADAERKRRARANPGNPTPPAPFDATQSVRRTSAGRPRDGAGNVPYRTLPYLTRERDAREIGDLSSSDAPTEHNEPLSLPQEKTSPEAEAEQLAADPKAAKDAGRALYDAWCEATGISPKSSSERKNWVAKLTEMARDFGLSPPDCAALIAQYRAKLGNDKHPTPGQVAAIYSQLGVSPHVYVHPDQRRVAARGALTAEEYARQRQALAAARGASNPELRIVGTGSDVLP